MVVVFSLLLASRSSWLFFFLSAICRSAGAELTRERFFLSWRRFLLRAFLTTKLCSGVVGGGGGDVGDIGSMESFTNEEYVWVLLLLLLLLLALTAMASLPPPAAGTTTSLVGGAEHESSIHESSDS
jgi:hypothetical protein